MIPALSVTPRSRRRSWFLQFRTRLGQCTSLDEVETLLKVKVRQWRGSTGKEGAEAIDDDAGAQEGDVRLTGFLDDGEVSDSYGMHMLEK
jgi:hypothetical protein